MKILGEQKLSGQIAQRLNQRWKKRRGLIATVFLVAIFLFVIGGTALGGYTTTQISNSDYGIYGSLDMNAGGQVVWPEQTSTGAQIVLYTPGLATQQLAVSGYMNDNSRINNSGQVVWSGDGIFLYSGGAITKLADNGRFYNSWPQINNNGQVVWQGRDAEGDYETFLYTPGLGTTQITDSGYYGGGSPQINDSGQVVWSGGPDPWSSDIFLYSGGVNTQLTNTQNNYGPQINNSGQVIWVGGGDWENRDIFLYSGGVTTRLTADSDYNGSPQINDSGQVVWVAWDGDPWAGGQSEIFIYSGGVASQLTNNDYNDESPQINNSGQVVWHGGRDFADEDIFFYSGGVTNKITNNDYPNYAPRINDSGQVSWMGYDGDPWGEGHEQIFLASPCSNSSKPSLTLSRAAVYWASYGDYQARALSVDYNVANAGSDPAQGVMITGSTATNGVSLLTAMPLSVGDLAGGSAAARTLKYTVPPGVSGFRATVNAGVNDACGNSYTYP